VFLVELYFCMELMSATLASSVCIVTSVALSSRLFGMSQLISTSLCLGALVISGSFFAKYFPEPHYYFECGSNLLILSLLNLLFSFTVCISRRFQGVSTSYG